MGEPSVIVGDKTVFKPKQTESIGAKSITGLSWISKTRLSWSLPQLLVTSIYVLNTPTLS